MIWFAIGIILAVLVFGYAVIKVGADAERRCEIQRGHDEHEQGLPL